MRYAALLLWLQKQYKVRWAKLTWRATASVLPSWQLVYNVQ